MICFNFLSLFIYLLLKIDRFFCLQDFLFDVEDYDFDNDVYYKQVTNNCY